MKEREIYKKWVVEIHGGKVVFEQRKEFDEFLIPLEGKKRHLIIKPITRDRSRQEEKFYWGVVIWMISQAMDTEPNIVHKMLTGWFLKIEEEDGKGRRFERVLSTTELSDRAYRDYWKKCQQWAGLPTGEGGLGPESGIELYIPDPNEVDYSNY